MSRRCDGRRSASRCGRPLTSTRRSRAESRSRTCRGSSSSTPMPSSASGPTPPTISTAWGSARRTSISPRATATCRSRWDRATTPSSAPTGWSARCRRASSPISTATWTQLGRRGGNAGGGARGRRVALSVLFRHGRLRAPAQQRERVPLRHRPPRHRAVRHSAQTVIPQIDLVRQHAALAGELLAATSRVLASSRFILGPEVKALESELASLGGARHGIGLNSGTDALLLALKAVGVGPGDEVITSAFSFVASASTVAMLGAVPVFVDIDPGTYNLDPRRLEAAVTPRTRCRGARAPVRPARRDGRDRGHRPPAGPRGDRRRRPGRRARSYDGRPHRRVGRCGGAAFYPTKNLGGLRRRRHGAHDARRRRGTRAPAARPRRGRGNYVHAELGYSSRLDELQAAFLRVKLAHLGGWTEARRRLAARYREGLAGLGLGLPVERPPARHVYHQFAVRAPRRDALAAALAARGMAARALPDDPAVPAALLPLRRQARCPHAAQAAAEMLGLPCSRRSRTRRSIRSWPPCARRWRSRDLFTGAD